MVVARVVPLALSRGEVEVVDLASRRFARLPVGRQRRLEPLFRDPEELLVGLQVHAQPRRVFNDLSLRGLVVRVDLLLQHRRLAGLTARIVGVWGKARHERRRGHGQPARHGFLNAADPLQVGLQVAAGITGSAVQDLLLVLAVEIPVVLIKRVLPRALVRRFAVVVVRVAVGVLVFAPAVRKRRIPRLCSDPQQLRVDRIARIHADVHRKLLDVLLLDLLLRKLLRRGLEVALALSQCFLAACAIKAELQQSRHSLRFCGDFALGVSRRLCEARAAELCSERCAEGMTQGVVKRGHAGVADAIVGQHRRPSKQPSACAGRELSHDVVEACRR